MMNWATRAYFPKDPTALFADPAIGPADYIIAAQGLDTQYPTVLGESFDDSPLTSAPNMAAGSGGTLEHEATFSTYLFWVSSRLVSIPVALRRVDWEWSFNAVAQDKPNDPDPNHWEWGPPLNISADVSGGYVVNSYPEWNHVVDMSVLKYQPLL
jgi:hypothetical protein